MSSSFSSINSKAQTIFFFNESWRLCPRQNKSCLNMDGYGEWPCFARPFSAASLHVLLLSTMTVAMLGTSTRSAKGRDEGWKKKNLFGCEWEPWGLIYSQLCRYFRKKKEKLMLLDAKLWELAKLIEVISWARKDTMLQTGLTFGLILLYNASLHKAISPSL